ncbi:MAG: beta-ketoacyl-ACP synthase II [Synoicihabitans sp.]
MVAPNGSDIDSFWQSLCEGRSAAKIVRAFDRDDIPCKVACEVDDTDFENWVDAKQKARLDRSLLFAISAAKKAVENANLKIDTLDPNRIGVAEGTSVSGLDNTLRSHEKFLERGYRSIKPSNLVTAFCGGGSSEIALSLGIQGQATTICTACSAGNDAIAHATREIEDDVADVMIAGASEAPVVAGYYSIFAAAGVMSRELENPPSAMKPFDKNRDGFVLGEGGTYLILEEYYHALGRGAHIYAEVKGFGRSCDAHHQIALHPEGRGTKRALMMALRDSGIAADEIDYVNAHGSATAQNDIVETESLKAVFGDHARRFAVSATKPVTGHLAGASAAIEAAICALAIDRAMIPPTINLEQPEAVCDLDYVGNGARPLPVRAALNMNSGFGGKQTALILKRVEDSG